jgi:hypothetical protein
MNENTNRAEPARVPVDRIIGANIHTLMWRNHDSQVKIAGMLGLSQGALSHKLRGKRPWTPTEIDYMAHHYRMDHGALFTKLPDLDSMEVREVGPTGLEPMTSTVQSGWFAPVIPLFGKLVA